MRPRPEPEQIELSILYEDHVLVAVNKPAGVVVHPTYKNWTGTLLNGLLWHVRDRPGCTPSILTRLDKDTSGLVLIALTPDVQARVQKDTAARLVTKEYLAVVRGQPEPAAGTIALPLARDVADRRRVVVTEDGQASETRYQLVGTTGALAVLRCELVTGRTHQIRVHLASRGWPIVGDAVYGVPWDGVTRQALHAWRIALPHPITRTPLAIEAPLAPDLERLVPGDLKVSGYQPR
jgi:23S rRNA pseudouridine1911/1915/1917 synthase